MHNYTPEQIEGTRDYFRSQGFEEIGVELEDLSFSYFVMPQELEPLLPEFVFRCTGDDPNRYVFGISNSVHEKFRRYAVAHEFIEFTQIGIDTKGRCGQALDRELELVPDDIKEDYLSMRLRFFSNLIDYCQEKSDKYTLQDIHEFEGSRSKLEKLLESQSS
jgi:hypothetical protein